MGGEVALLVTADLVTSPTGIELMTSFYSQKTLPSAIGGTMTRKPTRVTATLNWGLHQSLQERADREGRSLSNLIGYLLESVQEKQE